MTFSLTSLQEIKQRTILSWSGEYYGGATIRWVKLDDSGNYGYVIGPIPSNPQKRQDLKFLGA
jgi:hypothetical protein